MKTYDYRPQALRTMDPSYRFKQWRWEKYGGRLFEESRRIATYHSAYAAVAMGVLFGGRILSVCNDYLHEYFCSILFSVNLVVIVWLVVRRVFSYSFSYS